MKGNHLFIICIAVFLLLMFAIECRLPKKFVWAPSFSHYDKQPFGCAVFDSLLSTSLPKGYSLSRKTFYELELEDTISRRGILVATNNLSLTDVDIEAILKIAKRGNVCQHREAAADQSDGGLWPYGYGVSGEDTVRQLRAGRGERILCAQ